MVGKGSFICVEGLDGCGKTTQAKVLAERLGHQYKTVYTAEPSQGEIGTFIREYCLTNENRLSSIVEALLFAADRFEHVKNEVIPAVFEGTLVISDRYLCSSLAYQGAAGVSLEWIQKINQNAINPDLVIFIDVEPKVAINRLKREKSVMENVATLKKVREIYMKFVQKGDLVRVEGNRPPEEVGKDILFLVRRFLKNRC